MSFAQDALNVLAGGLPALIDYGNQVPANAQGDTGAAYGTGERTKPVGTIRDREPGLLSGAGGLSTGAMIGIGVGVLALIVGVVVLARK